MFSATMPPAVERLARKYLRNPVVVKFVFSSLSRCSFGSTSYLYQYAISCDLDTDDSLFLDLLDDCALNHFLLFVGHNWNGRKGY